MTTYTMTPLGTTRLRKEHNTFASVLGSYREGKLVEGDEIWEALMDGSEVKRGDIWLHVTSVDGVPLLVRGWMAYIHKGIPICNNLTINGEVPVPVPPPFPDNFILQDVDGNQAEYKFIRILTP